jgi:hypothetical protein
MRIGKSRALLPDFSPKLFRSSMASAHYTASQGDIMAAKAVLNHANVATTDIYVDGEAVRRLERDTIARLQSLMITWVTGETPAMTRNIKGGYQRRVTALFGHDCLRPVDGGQAQPGRVCPKLGGCLACPGLIVPSTRVIWRALSRPPCILKRRGNASTRSGSASSMRPAFGR